jgi:aryl-alcohol dehydrogenase-like predicted oxidoreductase
VPADGLGPNDRRLSAYHIRRACEASLRRLRTDHIDLYQMHHVDRATPWEEIWQAMEQLIREVKITYVGSSNFAGWDVALAQSAASVQPAARRAARRSAASRRRGAPGR